MKSLFALIALTAAQSGTSPVVTLLDACAYGRDASVAIGTAETPFDSCTFTRDRSSPRSVNSTPPGIIISVR